MLGYMQGMLDKWLANRLAEDRKAGRVCVLCPKEIPISSIRWAARNGKPAPRYCYYCSKARKYSPKNS
jgi:hypothetical protein